jgi:hypothetical protein
MRLRSTFAPHSHRGNGSYEYTGVVRADTQKNTLGKGRGEGKIQVIGKEVHGERVGREIDRRVGKAIK